MPLPGEEEDRFVAKLKSFLEQRVVPGLKDGKTVEIRIGGNEFDRLAVGPFYANTFEDVRQRIGEHARFILLEKFNLRSYPRLEMDGRIVFPPNDEGAPPITAHLKKAPAEP